MADSSDAIIKNEIFEAFGESISDLKIRIFPQSSNDDQILFEKGGLTFSYENVSYGSCDTAWYIENDKGTAIPKIALEGTDCLSRNSSGNAQYQRFHHALGAVKNGLVGVYYLKKGNVKIQEDLFGMAYFASRKELGKYIIIDDLNDLKKLLEIYQDKEKFNQEIDAILIRMYKTFSDKFNRMYKGSWENFAEKRSTIIKSDYVIKYAGRMRRNFTDSSQRAGHIAVGEMYLTKYYFYDKNFIYLFPKMTKADLDYLDIHKSGDKEWYLLRNEPNVTIKTMDDISGLSEKTKNKLLSIKDEPLKGDALKIYNSCIEEIKSGLLKDTLKIT